MIFLQFGNISRHIQLFSYDDSWSMTLYENSPWCHGPWYSWWLCTIREADDMHRSRAVPSSHSHDSPSWAPSSGFGLLYRGARGVRQQGEGRPAALMGPWPHNERQGGTPNIVGCRRQTLDEHSCLILRSYAFTNRRDGGLIVHGHHKYLFSKYSNHNPTAQIYQRCPWSQQAPDIHEAPGLQALSLSISPGNFYCFCVFLVWLGCSINQQAQSRSRYQ